MSADQTLCVTAIWTRRWRNSSRRSGAIRRIPKLRVFLFQLLSVQGDWERALTQLNTAAEMDASALAMAQMYREALQCEVLRAEVFAGHGRRWSSASRRRGSGSARSAAADGRGATTHAAGDAPRSGLRGGAGHAGHDRRPAVRNGSRMRIPRLGPVLEAIVNGRYYWIPIQHIRQIDVEPPTDLRDLVWMPAHFMWANGGEAVGVIPTRYPGSERSDDDIDPSGAQDRVGRSRRRSLPGLGQRMLTHRRRGIPADGSAEDRV